MIARFTGFGGQGVLLLGQVYGSAAVQEGKRALQTQSYGSSARGGSSRSDLTIRDEPINELEAEYADVIVCMSQPAFERYGHTVAPGGTLIYDSNLVKPAPTKAARTLGVPATQMAKDRFGSEMFANTLLLGFTAQVIGVVDPDAVRDALLARIPRKVEENRQAFELGRLLAREALGPCNDA